MGGAYGCHEPPKASSLRVSRPVEKAVARSSGVASCRPPMVADSQARAALLGHRPYAGQIPTGSFCAGGLARRASPSVVMPPGLRRLAAILRAASWGYCRWNSSGRGSGGRGAATWWRSPPAFQRAAGWPPTSRTLHYGNGLHQIGEASEELEQGFVHAHRRACPRAERPPAGRATARAMGMARGAPRSARAS